MPADPLRGAAAIVGLGITPQGKVFHTGALGFAVDAVKLALDDAGLAREDIDGLLLNPGLAWADLGMGSFQLQQAMGLRNLRLSATMNLGGATACAMIQHASQAIAAGLATTVVCVFSDMPLKPPAPKGDRASAASASTPIEPQASPMKLSTRTAASTRCEPGPSVWSRVERRREDMPRKLVTSRVGLQGIEPAFFWGDTVGLLLENPLGFPIGS